MLMIFENNEVEVFEWNGKVLFNPKHVAECLDIADVNSSIRAFNEKQVIKLKNSDMHNMHIRKLNNAGENFLTESGVYKLIFKSNKKEAEKFQDWVSDEVLPSIRKHGMYITDELLSNNELLEDRIRELQFDRELLEEKQEELEKENKILKKMKYACEYISYESKNESSYLPNLAKQIIKTYIGNNKGKDKLIQVTDEGYILNKREVYKEVSKIVMRKSDIHKLLTVMGVKADTRTIFVSDEILSDEYVYYGFNLCV